MTDEKKIYKCKQREKNEFENTSTSKTCGTIYIKQSKIDTTRVPREERLGGKRNI